VTGIVAATLGGGAAGSSGGVVTPGATICAPIYGQDTAYDSPITITTITVPISVTASLTGAGAVLHYQLNGVMKTYAGAFTVNPGDYLSWGVSCGHAGASGTITVTNATTSTVLQSFAYLLISSFGIGGSR